LQRRRDRYRRSTGLKALDNHSVLEGASDRCVAKEMDMQIVHNLFDHLLEEPPMKKVTSLILAAVALGSASVYADDREAQEFVNKAAVSNTFEIASSELAVERADNEVVRDFAERMIADHKKAGKDLKAAVDKSGMQLTVPKELDKKHQAMVQELRDAEGSDFDQRYIAMQAKAHDEAVGLFEDYSENEDAEQNLRDFAVKTLPTLETHNHRVEGIVDEDLVAERD
jgi:putative membrane protein